ncbi:MAG: Crp/Fnr family transcriptional regulator [Pirellulaceae bacterium]
MSASAYEIIGRCPLFAKIHERRREKLAEFSRIWRFPKGQTIFRQGDACPGIYIVGSGMVRVFKIGPSGKEHVLHIVTPCNTFAEVAAIGRFDCPANAETIAATTCALVPTDLFRKQMESDHQLCLEMVEGMSFWVRHTVTLLEDVVLRDAVGRVARFLLEAELAEDGTVKLPSLKRHVANHLNLTSETFSRTFGRLIEAGLVVDLEHNRVRLVNEPGLRAVSEGMFPKL